MVAIEIHEPGRFPIDWGDGTIAIACQNNLHDMVHAIRAQTQMHSIEVLRITSPGIIAILIGLLLPAVQKVRRVVPGQTSARVRGSFAQSRIGYAGDSIGSLNLKHVKATHGETSGEREGHSIGSLNFNQPLPGTQMGEILPYIEQSLKFLHPYFAQPAQVEIRATNVAVGDVNGDGLGKLAQAFGVPVLIGRVASNVVSRQCPVIKATPAGTIQRVHLDRFQPLG